MFRAKNKNRDVLKFKPALIEQNIWMFDPDGTPVYHRGEKLGRGKRDTEVMKPAHVCYTYSASRHSHLLDHALGQIGSPPVMRDSVKLYRLMGLYTFLEPTKINQDERNTRLRTGRYHELISKYLMKHNPYYASLVLDARFGVYRKEWAPVIREAFNCEDPPTPKEFLRFLMQDPAGPLMHNAMLKMPVCTASMFFWYVIGGQVEHIAPIYGLKPEKMLWSMAQAVKAMQTQLPFRLWCVGSDLTVLPQTTQTRHYFNRIQGARVGYKESIKGTGRDKLIAEIRRLQKSDPMFQMIWRDGLRLHPIERYLNPKHSVWAHDTYEALQEDLETCPYLFHHIRHFAKLNWLHKSMQENGVYLVPGTIIKFPQFRGRTPNRPLSMTTNPIMQKVAEVYASTSEQEIVAGLARLYPEYWDYFSTRTGFASLIRNRRRPSRKSPERSADGQDSDGVLEGAT